MVFFPLVTACRLAGAPTRTSPSSAYATTDGVVRPPSEFSITFGVPPSITATQLLVVPKSMPMIFAILGSPGLRVSLPARQVGLVARRSTGRARPRFDVLTLLPAGAARDRHHRRTQDPVVEHVALLVDGDDGVRRRVALDHLDRLVTMRVELLARRVDFLHVRARE